MRCWMMILVNKPTFHTITVHAECVFDFRHAYRTLPGSSQRPDRGHPVPWRHLHEPQVSVPQHPSAPRYHHPGAHSHRVATHAWHPRATPREACCHSHTPCADPNTLYCDPPAGQPRFASPGLHRSQGCRPRHCAWLHPQPCRDETWVALNHMASCSQVASDMDDDEEKTRTTTHDRYEPQESWCSMYFQLFSFFCLFVSPWCLELQQLFPRHISSFEMSYWYFVTLLRWLIAWFEGLCKVDVMAAPFLFIVLCDQVLEKDKKKDKKITSVSYCTGQFQVDFFGNSCILYTLYRGESQCEWLLSNAQAVILLRTKDHHQRVGFRSVECDSCASIRRPVSAGGMGIAQWLECQTRDQKIAGLSPGRSSRRILFSRVNFLCWLIWVETIPPLYYCKNPSFCQKYRWPGTVKHACTLHMWLWSDVTWCTWNMCWDGSSFTRHQLCNNQTVQ